MKVIYTLPFKHLVKTTDKSELKSKIVGMLYSMLLVNAYLDDDITIYTDFDGLSIFSILPFNTCLINSTSLDNFNEIVLNKQMGQYLLINDNQYLMQIDCKGNYCYLINNKFYLNSQTFNSDIDIKNVHRYLDDILGNIYNRFLKRIDEKFV